jgi:hypothetical protein
VSAVCKRSKVSIGRSCSSCALFLRARGAVRALGANRPDGLKTVPIGRNNANRKVGNRTCNNSNVPKPTGYYLPYYHSLLLPRGCCTKVKPTGVSLCCTVRICTQGAPETTTSVIMTTAVGCAVNLHNTYTQATGAIPDGNVAVTTPEAYLPVYDR